MPNKKSILLVALTLIPLHRLPWQSIAKSFLHQSNVANFPQWTWSKIAKIRFRFTFEEAAGHIYLLLLKKDCYPRFIRSDSYKSLLANALKPRNMKKP